MADVDVLAQLQKKASVKDDISKESSQAADDIPLRQDDSKKHLINELRDRNRKETTFDFLMMGDLHYTVGITVQLDSSFGNFAGKYLIDKIVHKIGRQGYTADLSGHKVLVGYESQTSAPPKAPAAKPAGSYSPGNTGDPSGSPTPINAQLSTSTLGPGASGSPTPLGTQLGSAPGNTSIAKPDPEYVGIG